MTRRNLARTALAALGATSLLLVGSTAAQAHYTYVYHGSDLASVASDHERGSVCDQESDGHAVYGDYLLDGGIRRQVWDTLANGACVTALFQAPAEVFRLCEELPGADSCTAWKDT